MTEVLQQVVLPAAPRPDDPNGDEATRQFLRDEFVQLELQARFNRDGRRDDGAVVVDGQRVVVAVPEGKTLADWTYEVDGEERTAAEANPGYPADEQLVFVPFEAGLDEAWPAWAAAAPEDLFDGVKAYGVTHYGFSEGRLDYRTPPAALEAVVARVAPEVDAVEWNLDNQLLVVEKRGETYAIAPDGTVQGAGVFADRLEALVAGPPHNE